MFYSRNINTLKDSKKFSCQTNFCCEQEEQAYKLFSSYDGEQSLELRVRFRNL